MMNFGKSIACMHLLENYYKSFGQILQTIGLLVLVPATSVADVTGAYTLKMLAHPFPYEAKDMSAESTLEDFTRLTGLSVEGTVIGDVSVANQGGSASDFLDSLSEQTGSVWWFDGLAIRVEPRATMRSVVMGTRGVDISTLEDAMSFSGLSNERFATRMSADGTLFNVIGPRGYVAAVESLLDEIITARKTRRVGLPVVYRGEFNPTQEKDRRATQTAGSVQQSQIDER